MLAPQARWLGLALTFAALYPTVQEAIPDIDGKVPLRFEALLLPIALLFGWPAIFGVSLGSVIVHRYLIFRGLEDFDLSFTVTKALSFLLVLGLARWLFWRRDQWWRHLAIVWLIALGLTLALGGYWAIDQHRPDPLWSVFLSTLVPIALWGYLILELLAGEKQLYPRSESYG